MKKCSRQLVLIFMTILFARSFSAGAMDMPAAARSCGDCHGENGISKEADIPIIAGMSALYIEEQLLAYQQRERPCAEVKLRDGQVNKNEKSDMCRAVKDLDEKTIEVIAAWLATQPFVPVKQVFDAALAATGEKIHQRSCEKCHAQGASLADDDAGVMAGQWRHYLATTMSELRSGQRMMDKKMTPKIKELDDRATAALVEYYVSAGKIK